MVRAGASRGRLRGWQHALFMHVCSITSVGMSRAQVPRCPNLACPSHPPHPCLPAAYMLSSGGSDWKTIHIKRIDQETGETTGMEERGPAAGSRQAAVSGAFWLGGMQPIAACFWPQPGCCPALACCSGLTCAPPPCSTKSRPGGQAGPRKVFGESFLVEQPSWCGCKRASLPGVLCPAFSVVCL